MNSRAKQARFSDAKFKIQDQFGGDLLKKRCNRTARPISTKESMHLILKSSLAKGAMSFRSGSHSSQIDGIILKAARKNGVKLIKTSNNFNHLHLHIRVGSRELYKRFVRSICGSIAMLVTGAKKAKPADKIVGKRRFWDARPYSRIVRGWRGFKTANDYVTLNQLEAEGMIPKRATRLRGLETGEKRFFAESRKDAPPNESGQIRWF
jgi:hypothetical protein